jgi:DNA-binding NarL/FixJ family response regulator
MVSSGVTRVVIADDHPVVCVGVATLIAAQGWEVCATAADGEDAVARAAEMRPDIVVINYGMPRLNGLEAARRIERELPQVEILMFTGTRSPYALLQMYRSGVGGCLLKSEGAEELLAALESLRQHQRFRSRQITEVCQAIGQAAGDLETLTACETATLRLIADAKSSKEIAVELGISIKTVECHRTNPFRKLKVRSVAELVRYALRHGLVDI